MAGAEVERGERRGRSEKERGAMRELVGAGMRSGEWREMRSEAELEVRRSDGGEGWRREMRGRERERERERERAVS